MTTHGVARRLGGRRVLGRDVASDLDLVGMIEGGLPVAAIDAVVDAGILSLGEVHALVLPRRTLAHRRDRGQPLSADQSDRLARAVRVIARAEDALGDADKAHRWLRKPNRALRGKQPLALLDSDLGARMVEDVLGRIEHGLVA